MDDLFDGNDATGIAAAIRAGDVSAREVVELAVARIEARNPVINAVTERRIEAALAEVADGPPPGVLGGVPFAVKDLGADVAGMRSTGGSRLQADVVAHEDSAVVARYRAAGLVVVGTTNAPEWGRNASTEPVLHGPTRNPYRLSHSAGGSSGGSAAAVASGMVPVAHGNDGGGSIRIPRRRAVSSGSSRHARGPRTRRAAPRSRIRSRSTTFSRAASATARCCSTSRRAP